MQQSEYIFKHTDTMRIYVFLALCSAYIYYVQTSHVKTRLATARNFQDSFQSSRLLFHQKKILFEVLFYKGGKSLAIKRQLGLVVCA